MRLPRRRPRGERSSSRTRRAGERSSSRTRRAGDRPSSSSTRRRGERTRSRSTQRRGDRTSSRSTQRRGAQTGEGRVLRAIRPRKASLRFTLTAAIFAIPSPPRRRHAPTGFARCASPARATRGSHASWGSRATPFAASADAPASSERASCSGRVPGLPVRSMSAAARRTRRSSSVAQALQPVLSRLRVPIRPPRARAASTEGDRLTRRGENPCRKARRSANPGLAERDVVVALEVHRDLPRARSGSAGASRRSFRRPQRWWPAGCGAGGKSDRAAPRARARCTTDSACRSTGG